MILPVKLKLLCMFFSTYSFQPSGPCDTHDPLPLPPLLRGSRFNITHKFFSHVFVTGITGSSSDFLT